VGAPGGASGNFQSRARKISLNGCSTSRGNSHRGSMKEEEEEGEGEGGGGEGGEGGEGEGK
jgi:hypothetical protein